MTLKILCDGFAIARQHLDCTQPGKGLPSTIPQKHRNEHHTVALAAFQQVRNLFFCAEFGRQKIRRDQAYGHRREVHGLPDLLVPFLAATDPPVIPDRDAVRPFQDP